MTDLKSIAKEIWKNLENYGFNRSMADKNKFVNRKQTSTFGIFNINLIRALLPLYMDFDKSRFDYKPQQDIYFLQFPIEIVLNLVITSFEVYLRNSFIEILSLIDSKSKISLSNLFDERQLNFLYKDFCKKAFKSINIDIIEIIDSIDQDLWRRIYGGKEDKPPGYIKIRHDLTHQGIEAALNISTEFNVDLLKNLVEDVAKFIYTVDCEIISKYPRLRLS